MEWLNYHHLYYFWVTTREGSIVKSSEKLFVSQPTISAQIKSLENSIGEKLFNRVGRRLELTEAGHIAMRYADEIFGLGKEMRDTLKGRPTGKIPTLTVGVSDVMSKLVVYRLLSPLLESRSGVRLICREDKTDALIASLGAQKLDALLTDGALPSGTKIKAFSHLICESGISFFGLKEQASKLKKNFPKSLEKMPFLYPTENTILRMTLDQWFEGKGIRPKIIGEFEDSALMKVFGQHGAGLFTGPTYVEKEICKQYSVSILGRTEEIRENYFLISPERKVKQPSLIKILDASKNLKR